MKNIVLISCSIVYQDARVKSYIKTLIKQGYCVDLVSLKENVNDPFRSQEEGYVNYRVATRYIGNSLLNYIKYYFIFTLRVFFIVSFLAFKKKIDIVHYNNLPNFPVFAAIIPKILGARIILDNHDLITVMFGSKFDSLRFSSMLLCLLRLEQKLSMAFAQKVIAADHNQKEALLEDGVTENKITVILNVANEEWFRPVLKKERDDGEFRLIYHGTIAERLGLDVAIKAIAMIRDQIPRIRFYLIGKGDFLEECLKLIVELGLEDVVLPSKCYYPVEQLSDIIKKMDVGIVPNKKTQATDKYMLPVKLLEYVYMRLPVIAPRLKIIERYFDDDMIMFFEPGDHKELAQCILNLYRDKTLRRLLVERSRSFVDKYNWKSQEKVYLALIEV
jgi:glycosyltransferase involved in cell wall biosynthesis